MRIIFTVLFTLMPTFTVLSNNFLLDNTFVQVLSQKKNTGCHQFHHVTDGTIRAQHKDPRRNIEIGNISVNHSGDCYTAIYADLEGSYHGKEIRMFNIDSVGSEKIFLQVEGNLDLYGESIELGNIHAIDAADVISNIDVDNLDINGNHAISVGNINLKNGVASNASLSVQSYLNTESIKTSFGDIKAGNILLDKELLSETNFMSIKHDISVGSVK